MGLHYPRLNRAPCFSWSQDDLGVCACAIGTMACVSSCLDISTSGGSLLVLEVDSIASGSGV